MENSVKQRAVRADSLNLGEEPGGRSSPGPASCPASSASKPKTNPAEEAVRLPEEKTVKARTQSNPVVLSHACSRVHSVPAGALEKWAPWAPGGRRAWVCVRPHPSDTPARASSKGTGCRCALGGRLPDPAGRRLDAAF
ncbi:unnamed protein product [Rangifer tarandus platyrhynchus]|uniref:Uncharacterized protein n=2 Tax=Rangifer tarandus platyrhynchus TaxID=3082113 RepID=A0AC59ZMU3_RANTA|nr:unnamed protein product [Rangifer tarandus platyrhynchus]